MFVDGSGALVPILSIIILILLLVLAWFLWRQAGLRSGGDSGPKETLVNRHYAKDQVIIGGTAANIAAAVETIGNRDGFMIGLTEITYQTAVENGGYSVEGEKEERPAEPVSRPIITRLFQAAEAAADDAFQFQHYRVTANPFNRSIPEIEQELSKLNVCPSANYAIGKPIDMVEGDPGSGEGFPGSGEGFLTGQGQNQGHATIMNFLNQWALHAPSAAQGMGINLFKRPFNTPANPPMDTNRTVADKGRHCRIAVFDSSPYDDPKILQNPRAGNSQNPPAFIKKIMHNEVRGFPDARDHGLFVSALANVVAPESKIYLYRVLNDSNRGSLMTLLNNLCDAINEFKAETGQDDLCGLVINLSMGIHVEESLRQAVATASNRLERERELAPALYCLLERAHNEGAIIVAAVGNDSAQREQDNPKPAQVPALYSFVLGVEAGNFAGARSCFSNRGDVRAPGGDNLTDCVVQPYESLDFPQRLKTSVISYVKEISPETNYAFWRGSSFAAPLVSGLAALLLSMQMEKGRCAPGEIEQIIKGASPGQSPLQAGEPQTINVANAAARVAG